ncbi:MAG: polyisoprenoid-binding protein [Rhodanobacter denitrificans]|uniref:Polyisoprenoid-binding protein n=1 Tax=Rhodanobacter denitrificans TaxID=666685 RepID=A0A2W5K493_9GAMM|nr:MAG: polyisoprenoid-binding protein [Rhodanobacter denitrificans]
MLRRTVLASVLALVSAGAYAAPITYKLDPTHTDVLFTWNHLGFSNPTGHFGQIEGTLVYDEADPTRSSVEATLPLAGLDTHVTKLDEHLKKDEFLDAAKYPTITFKSTKVETAGSGKLKVTGDLTLRGVTKPVVLDVKLNGAGPHPMKKVPAIGFDATTTIKRSEFGIGAYVPNISDELKVSITTEALGPKSGG